MGERTERGKELKRKQKYKQSCYSNELGQLHFRVCFNGKSSEKIRAIIVEIKKKKTTVIFPVRSIQLTEWKVLLSLYGKVEKMR